MSLTSLRKTQLRLRGRLRFKVFDADSDANDEGSRDVLTFLRNLTAHMKAEFLELEKHHRTELAAMLLRSQGGERDSLDLK